MNHEEFGTTQDYLRAFRAMLAEGIHDNHLAMLRAHFAAPDHTATWAQLASAIGYTGFNSVNLQYGKLARCVAQQLGISQPPHDFWLFVLAGWAEERDPDSGHTAFVLRRPAIEALQQLGVIPDQAVELLPDELDADAPVREGARYQILVNAYERNPEARRQCIAAYGTTCCVCGFGFGAVYGPEAEGFIHVHHLRPLSEVDDEYIVKPTEDLRPVCPNCHAVIHMGGGCRSINEVRQLLARHPR